MKKLFVLLRQGNIDEIKRIISDKPELLNCVAGQTPKKDHGQSLLQVALKSGNLDIAEYLIDAGIDVNFMEAEDDDPGLRVPVMFDAITATIDSLCINQFSTEEEISKKFAISDKALTLLKRIIDNGADVNKRTSNGMDAINWSLHHAELIMGRPSVYPNSQEKVREQLGFVLDYLIENGADYIAWCDGGYYPEPCPGPSIKSLFFDEYEAVNNNEEYRQIKSFIRDYFASRNIHI